MKRLMDTKPDSPESYEESSSLPDLASNAFWRILTLLIKLFFQMFTLIILSRLLPVEAFGKLAYAMVFIGFVSMAARFGVTPAIIQRPELSERFLRASFTLSMLFGLVGTVLLFLTAPLFTSDVETVGLIKVISLIFVCFGFGSVAEAQLLRKFNFKAIFFVELIAFFLGYTCVSIGMALAGFGVWSLGVAAAVTALLRSLLMVFAKRKILFPCWSPEHFKDLLGFGAGLTLSAFMYFFSQNLDYFVAGNMLDDESLAYYARARHMVKIPSEIIIAAAYAILLSAFSRLRSDKLQLKELYIRSVSTVSLPTISIAVVLMLIAPQLLVLLFGSAWEASALPLQILALNCFFALYTIGDALFVSQRKIYWQLASQTTFAITIGLASLMGVKWGIVGISIGVLLCTCACYTYVAQMCLRLINASWTEFIQCQIPALVMALALAVTGGFIKVGMLSLNFPDWSIVLIVAIATLVVFAGLILSPWTMFNHHRGIVIEFWKKKSGSII